MFSSLPAPVPVIALAFVLVLATALLALLFLNRAAQGDAVLPLLLVEQILF